ncbi:MAG: precorrin-6Y C5,15-methyltransferase (decarboxylating) subunit CbiT [Tissierellia bacterium]|nr:precorrin-6Y C5,15-methyltransferase (decarboxylating) subunit CbiT [Tissierellia bacterium]
MKWIKDEEFIRGEVPMTKLPIRILSMAELEVSEDDRLLDIGAGTGSISIQAAIMGADVTAIDTNEDAVELVRENAKKFGLSVYVISGIAPNDLPDLKFNKVFVGGSKGKLTEIFEYLDSHLEKDGILVGNFIITKNVVEFTDLMYKNCYRDINVRMISHSQANKLGMMIADNPIYIVKGVKE